MLQPLFDRVLAIPIKTKKQTASGITLAESDEGEVKKAKIVAVGTGAYENGVFIDMKVEVDDVIFYEEHTVANFYNGEEQYILIKQSDILAKVKE